MHRRAGKSGPNGESQTLLLPARYVVGREAWGAAAGLRVRLPEAAASVGSEVAAACRASSLREAWARAASQLPRSGRPRPPCGRAFLVLPPGAIGGPGPPHSKPRCWGSEEQCSPRAGPETLLPSACSAGRPAAGVSFRARKLRGEGGPGSLAALVCALHLATPLLFTPSSTRYVIGRSFANL